MKYIAIYGAKIHSKGYNMMAQTFTVPAKSYYPLDQVPRDVF